MHNDDQPIGRVLSRRELVGLFGAFAAIAAASRVFSEPPAPDASYLYAPDCVAQPQQTEGPYFVDERLQRSDIRLDPSTGKLSQGSPLELRFAVSSIDAAGACAPLAGAQFDIWHCDANGVYSDVQDRSFDTKGQKFLRGYQVTDSNGLVTFSTIYPGWYPGRAVHIHFKIRVPGANGRTDEFTSQLYFDDAQTDRVHAQQPYAAKSGQRMINSRDMIFRGGGTQLILPVTAGERGYQSTFKIAMRPGEAPVRFGPGPGRPRRPR